jgi:hypothetical protein
MQKFSSQNFDFGGFAAMTRDQLKKIVGGVAPVGGSNTCPITVCPGYSLPNTNYYCVDTPAGPCQTAADKWCEGNDACCGVDCPSSFPPPQS